MKPFDNDTDLDRFVTAQAAVYPQALAELAAGRKTSHWMWFVLPQLRGLGQSAMAHRYGLASLDEARAYGRHPVLGARLRECCEALLAVQGRTAREIMGSPDDRKLCSCLTLFEVADPGERIFAELLEKYFGGQRDVRTLTMVAGER
jgi:uncharacterized protein (DUF1810 family)